ncbi:MAG TPA: hypothetical protein VKF38_11510 [Anaerolineaceae bacterium]|nr:hypothetical protein [Anaerolineaceae bacterium]
MTTQFDEKGKIYTSVIKKIPCDTIIQTVNNRIEGKVHVRPDDRLKDVINEQEMFIAVTEAVIYDNTGEVAYTSDLLLVNRAQIIWLLPAKKVQST